jgi:hypothetical protein
MQSTDRTTERRPRGRRFIATAVAAVIATVASGLVAAGTAHAFKPYSHVVTATTAREDAIDDCKVWINDAEYPVIPEVCASIQAYPSFYNAGVIGPDGFPDLTFGQAVIHPEETGKWLRHLHQAAWALWDANPGSAEAKQALAFTYGFMTHAAGDLWAHTLVNTFADGVFPGVFDMVDEITGGGVNADGERDLVEIALRHIIVEGYIGDATPGYDGNDDNRNLVPGEVNEDGDPEVSEDSTPGTPFDAPMSFIYDTLVDPNATLPVGVCGDGLDDDGDGTADDGCPGGPYTVGEDPEPQRGPAIDYFLDKQADLQIEKAKMDADAGFTDCLDIDPDCYTVGESNGDGTITGYPLSVAVSTVRGDITVNVDVQRCIGAQIGCVVSPLDLADDLIINDIGSAYLGAWIDDIATGLQEWPRIGLELTKLLFDSTTYRKAQDHACRNGIVDDDEHLGNGGDLDSGYRASCENGVGFGEILAYTMIDPPNGDSYLTDHLLSMLGAPDFVGAGFEIAGDVLTFLLDIIQTIIPNFDFLADFADWLKEGFMDLVSAALGFDVETLFSFLKHPTYWLDQQTMSIDLPFGLSASVDLFPADAREMLDELMGLGPSPLVVDNDVELPNGQVVSATRLADWAEWTYEDFDVAANAVQLSKMVLLDGETLNDVIAGQLAADPSFEAGIDVQTYTDPLGGPPANVMIDALTGDDPWLVSIDSDHAWRQDGEPVNVPRDPGVSHGGNGQFPLWESCIARPAFRSLFRDWEPDTAGPNGTDANFGDLGDATSYDATAQPATVGIGFGGSTALVSGTRYLGVNHTITVTADDPVFADSAVTIHYRTYPQGGPAGAWQTAPGPAVTLSLPGAYTDGTYVVEYQASNPCIPAAASGTQQLVVLDETPPTVTITAPAHGAVFDVYQASPFTATFSDAGAGVDAATTVFTFDGGTVTMPYTIDMFTLLAGNHTTFASAEDLVDNVGSDTNVFELRPTSAGILAVMNRAYAEGLVTNAGVLKSLKETLTVAKRAHTKGQHGTEWNALAAALEIVAAQRGLTITPEFADRMRQWITYLIAYEQP